MSSSLVNGTQSSTAMATCPTPAMSTQRGSERTMTILEPGEDESGPSDLLCDIVQHDHDRQCRQACGKQQQPILGESAQRREAIEDRDGDQQDQLPSKQADRIPAQRHPPPEAAPGQVPYASLTAYQGGDDEGRHSRPEDVLQHPVRRRSAREKPRLGQPLGDKDEGRRRRVHQHQERGDRMPDDPRPQRREIRSGGLLSLLSHDRYVLSTTSSWCSTRVQGRLPAPYDRLSPVGDMQLGEDAPHTHAH